MNFNPRYTGSGIGLFRVIVIAVLLVSVMGCATPKKFRHVKAVPCPCEKLNKR